ncbi:TPA: hypothetical protein QCX22_004835 [Bacillus toyonensis]|nr:hypothetical protein [Bacillus toyonensis]
MHLPVIAVIHDTPKRRSLFEDFAFLYIEHESFQFLLFNACISFVIIRAVSRVFVPVPCIL